MASADATEDLTCSICLNVYTDPVTLLCGHNFCRVCIDRVLDTQEASGGYSCPHCREGFLERPALRKNTSLASLAENLRAQTLQAPSGAFCTYCIHDPVPAIKSCLHCNANLCADHLRTHDKSPEHLLMDPQPSLENGTCSIHREALKYYCIQDAVCICLSCVVVGQHQSHPVDELVEASKKKKENLREVLQKLTLKVEEVEKKIDRLQNQWREIQGKTADLKQKATTTFRDLRSLVDLLEENVLAEISRQEEQGSQSHSNIIRDLEAKIEELARNVLHIKELLEEVDPVTVLQDLETNRGDFCDMKPIDDMNLDIMYKRAYATNELDERPITAMVQTLSLLLKDLKCGVTQEPTKLSLTKNKDCKCITVSDDLKSLSISSSGCHSVCSYKVALSVGGFSSGTHYWDVEVGKSGSVGVCYASLINEQQNVEDNAKSWWLSKYTTTIDMESTTYFRILHNNYSSRIPNPSSNKFRIYLDYDAGQISFYELCTPIRHLHTFTAKFTEPLHAAFYGSDTKFKVNQRKKPNVQTGDPII